MESMIAARDDRAYRELVNSRLLDAESTEMRARMQQLSLDVENHIVELEVKTLTTPILHSNSMYSHFIVL